MPDLLVKPSPSYFFGWKAIFFVIASKENLRTSCASAYFQWPAATPCAVAVLLFIIVPDSNTKMFLYVPSSCSLGSVNAIFSPDFIQFSRYLLYFSVQLIPPFLICDLRAQLVLLLSLSQCPICCDTVLYRILSGFIGVVFNVVARPLYAVQYFPSVSSSSTIFWTAYSLTSASPPLSDVTGC